MKQIVLNFLKTDFDNIFYGAIGLCILLLTWAVTKDTQLISPLFIAMAVICINKMRGKNGNGNSDENPTEAP